MLTDGADIGFRGTHYSRRTRNCVSAGTYAEVLRKNIRKEIDLLHSVGPFSNPPFQDFVINALSVREKKSGGHRIILDLSRPFVTQLTITFPKKIIPSNSAVLMTPCVLF